MIFFAASSETPSAAPSAIADDSPNVDRTEVDTSGPRLAVAADASTARADPSAKAEEDAETGTARACAAVQGIRPNRMVRTQWCCTREGRGGEGRGGEGKDAERGWGWGWGWGGEGRGEEGRGGEGRGGEGCGAGTGMGMGRRWRGAATFSRAAASLAPLASKSAGGGPPAPGGDGSAGARMSLCPIIEIAVGGASDPGG
jgi:hypothetical protein